MLEGRGNFPKCNSLHIMSKADLRENWPTFGVVQAAANDRAFSSYGRYFSVRSRFDRIVGSVYAVNDF